MSDIRQARQALVTRIQEGEGKASPSDRCAAFNNGGLAESVSVLIAKVATHADTVNEDDISAAQVGLSEDQIFELVVCAAVGQATPGYSAPVP